MKNSYIPVNNSIDKALAFAPTLSESYRKTNQRITTKPKYIETINVVNDLMKQGWLIDGVCENRNKSSFKIDSHYIKMSHPDLQMKTISGKTECISVIDISSIFIFFKKSFLIKRLISILIFFMYFIFLISNII